MINLNNKVSVVTGAGGYIGSAIVNALVESESTVIAIDSNKSRLIKLRNSVNRKYNTLIEIIPLDVSSAKNIAKIKSTLSSNFKKIDILINSIGMVGDSKIKGWSTPFEKQLIGPWKKAIDVNLTSVFFLVQALKKLLDKGTDTSVINISSIYGSFAPDFDIYKNTKLYNPAAYSISKAGLTYMTKWLAASLAPNIRVNTVSPGGIYRNQDKKFVNKYSKNTLLGRMGKEEDIIGSVLFLASNMSSYITGQNIFVDGGWSIK